MSQRMNARDEAVTHMAALLQKAIGYAREGALLTDGFAIEQAEPVVDALLAAVAEQVGEGDSE